MYTLRKIMENEAIINISLGEAYAVVYQTEKSKTEFESCAKEWYGNRWKEDIENYGIYAFISSNGELNPISTKHRNFIMTDSGKTFEKV